jgi:hypothetical protein
VTTDALLALSLNIVIPSLLAVAGAALAIRAFKDANSRERWTWIAVFAVLFVLAVGLGLVQQVRLTAQQRASDEKNAASELRLSNENKYTQGQLDSINKVLTTVATAMVSNGGSSPALLKELLKALASQAGDASKKIYSNTQLKEAAFVVARKLRGLHQGFADSINSIPTSPSRDSEIAIQLGKHKAEVVQLLPEVRHIRTLILSRIPAQSENAAITRVIDAEKLSNSGKEPVEIADYLEGLARLLPAVP